MDPAVDSHELGSECTAKEPGRKRSITVHAGQSVNEVLGSKPVFSFASFPTRSTCYRIPVSHYSLQCGLVTA